MAAVRPRSRAEDGRKGAASGTHRRGHRGVPPHRRGAAARLEQRQRARRPVRPRQAGRQGRRAVHAHRRSPGRRGLLSEGRGALQEDPQDQAGSRSTRSLQSGDIAAKQGLLADAKTALHSSSPNAGSKRGDKKGAAEISIRIGTLDPEDLDARLGAARAAAEIGDAETALREFREVALKFEKAGKAAECAGGLPVRASS